MTWRSSPTSTTASRTLADRFLELSGAVDPRNMRAQYLDSMDIERERGITIKAQNVRLNWNDHVRAPDRHARPRRLRVRGLAEPGRLRRRDPAGRRQSQGIEAQTLANCYLAVEHDLAIVAALNKIDLPAAEPDRVAGEIERVLGIPAEEILRISAKTGEGVPELLDAVIERIPAPTGDADAPLQALIFDSLLRRVPRRRRARCACSTARSCRARGCASCRPTATHDAEEIGVRLPAPTPGRERSVPARSATSSRASRTSARRVSARRSPPRRGPRQPLEGYLDPKPMVFCGLYPVDGDEYADLREALEKLRLNDSSFTYEPETSGALGFGFRCGFLGLLHMEIVRERLEREYDLALVATAPNVEYRANLVDGSARGRRQPVGDAAAEPRRVDRGAVRHDHDPHADRVRRHAHGARASSAGAR